MVHQEQGLCGTCPTDRLRVIPASMFASWSPVASCVAQFILYSKMCIEGANSSQCIFNLPFRRPFKDPCLITAQVLSIVAVALSLFNLWGWYVMLFVGLPAFILLQVGWCCTVNKCGFITAGVLALVGSGIVLVAAVLILVWLNEFWDDCDTYSNYFDDDFFNQHTDCTSDYEESTAILWLSLGVISAVLWLITGILVLIFACGQRYKACEEKLGAEAAGTGTNQTTIATAAPVNAQPAGIKDIEG
eukprot:scaffold9308_cov115-Cylindrotheca_fusiformis.AAC.4